MSIAEKLAKCKNDGTLLLHRSEDFELWGLAEDETARTLYITANVSAAVQFPFPDTPDGIRRGEFRAWLDSFVEGGELSVSEDPDNKPPYTMFARVRPVEAEFWSIRVTTPEETPGIRSVGAFSAKDEFVALTWDYREVIDIQFNEEVGDAIEIWTDLFGQQSPHKGNQIHEYLTYCDPV